MNIYILRYWADVNNDSQKVIVDSLCCDRMHIHLSAAVRTGMEREKKTYFVKKRDMDKQKRIARHKFDRWQWECAIFLFAWSLKYGFYFITQCS